MSKLEEFQQAYGLNNDNSFLIVLGMQNAIVPGGTWTSYWLRLNESTITLINDKLGVEKEISYDSFQVAEFGIGSGNLWLQCKVDGNDFVFCSTKKNWKSAGAKAFMQKLSHIISDTKAYEQFTGKLSWLYRIIK